MRRRWLLPALALAPFAAKLASGDQTVYVPGGDVAYTDAIFVGKHGSDSASGTGPKNAKLTIQAALDEASALGPDSSNQILVLVSDGGVYAESLAIPSYVNLYAPFATLSGECLMVGNSRVVFDQLIVATGETGILATNDVANSVEVKRAVASGTGNLFRCTGAGAVLIVEWCATAIAANGTIVGGVSDGHIHYHGGDGYISGTGSVVERTAAGEVLADIDHMINLGAGAGTGVKITGGGEVDLRSFHIDLDTAFHLQASGAICNASVHRAEGATNLVRFQGPGGTLNLLAHQASGATTGSGTANIKLVPSL